MQAMSMNPLTNRTLLVSARVVGRQRCRHAVRRFATHVDSSIQDTGERYSVIVSSAEDSDNNLELD